MSKVPYSPGLLEGEAPASPLIDRAGAWGGPKPAGDRAQISPCPILHSLSCSSGSLRPQEEALGPFPQKQEDQVS